MFCVYYHITCKVDWEKLVLDVQRRRLTPPTNELTLHIERRKHTTQC